MASTPQNLYAPPKSTVADPTSSEPFELAERLRRLGASVIDGLTVLLPLTPLWVMMVPLMMKGPGSGMRPSMLLGVLIAIGTLIVLGIGIYNLVLLDRAGQTIGKKMMHIRIVRTDGSRATLGRIFWLRGLVSALPGIIPVFGHVYRLADLLFIFGNARRCIHDYIADTIVVKA
jgi:uncharacterized RDD family membrane protein YckC